MRILDQLRASRPWREDERIVLDQVRRVATQVIAPAAAANDEQCRFPRESVAALTEIGLNAIFVPPAYGGALMSYALYLECVAIIAEACASTGIIYATTCHGMGPLIQFGTEEQCARLLPRIAEGGLGALAIIEPHAGSDATGMRTRFTPDGAEVIIDGGKRFITNGDVADRYLLFGKWNGIEEPGKAITALIIEGATPGLEIVRLEKKLGHRASSTAELRFDGCRVPRANVLGAPGEGLNILLASLNRSRPSIAAHALGIARGAFNDMVSYVNEREQSGRRVIDFQGNQFTIADLAAELAMLEHWLAYVATLVDGGAQDFGLEASIAKLRASDLAMRMSTEAVQMHGGYGYCQDYRVERLMRDAKITQIWEGTNQLHRQLIGRSFASK
ncbi:MAG: acyl-CoA dehydrogenase [Gammaproteobacteria bacterium]|nr:acyl-CoA dehydrogenase [Gammaproteobacteria bacterium]